MAYYSRRHIQEEPSGLRSNGVCKFCENEVCQESNGFYCHTCRSYYHKDCLTITYPKIHEHTLTFIHKDNSFYCDACGYIEQKNVDMFVCLKCNFFVHRSCIFLPKVIKITRHSHYLSHTLSIPPGNLDCTICWNRYRKLKIGYGGYKCIEKACDYVAHSYCATMKIVWDGRDVEGEPEEHINSEADLAVLVEIDGGSVRHFSHNHDLMRLDVDHQKESGHEVCQACILPIEFGKFLGCKQCQFALHDACANLPHKMENALHRHPLTLRIDLMSTKKGFFTCSSCHRESCGFMYQCSQEDCGFEIDVKCASFVEPFNDIYHPEHPLLLAQKFKRGAYVCKGCDRYITTDVGVAHCNICVFFLDFRCLTLPRLVKYKLHVHPLILYCDKSYSGCLPWCEICEEKIEVNKFFYVCYDCITTLHIECMLGKYPYLKPNHRIKVDGLNLEIRSNNSASRSICYTCHRICQDKLVFISEKDVCFCSIDCIHSSTKFVENLT